MDPGAEPRRPRRNHLESFQAKAPNAAANDADLSLSHLPTSHLASSTGRKFMICLHFRALAVEPAATGTWLTTSPAEQGQTTDANLHINFPDPVGPVASSTSIAPFKARPSTTRWRGTAFRSTVSTTVSDPASDVLWVFPVYLSRDLAGAGAGCRLAVGCGFGGLPVHATPTLKRCGLGGQLYRSKATGVESLASPAVSR